MFGFLRRFRLYTHLLSQSIDVIMQLLNLISDTWLSVRCLSWFRDTLCMTLIWIVLIQNVLGSIGWAHWIVQALCLGKSTGSIENLLPILDNVLLKAILVFRFMRKVDWVRIFERLFCFLVFLYLCLFLNIDWRLIAWLQFFKSVIVLICLWDWLLLYCWIFLRWHYIWDQLSFNSWAVLYFSFFIFKT